MQEGLLLLTARGSIVVGVYCSCRGVWFVAAVGSIDAGCWESYYCWWESIVAGSQGILLQGIILSLAAEDLFYCFSYYH